MPNYSDQLVDDSGYRLPVSGALVYLLKADGSLASTTGPNPALTDDFGFYAFTAPDAVYTYEARIGGVTIAKGQAIVGAPAPFKGETGPADNTYTSYAVMQASDPTRKSARLVGDTDSPPHADGPYNNPTQTIGGWVAQSSLGVAYTPPAAAVITRSTQDRLADSIRAHDHGARGDDLPHPLSEKYATIEAAQAAYPGCNIVSLDDRVDGVAIQAALNRAEQLSLPGNQGGYATRAVVLLRAGRYHPSYPIEIPNTVDLVGAGSGATIIDAQNFTVAGPLIRNKMQGSVDMRVSGISLHGGTHGCKIDSGTNGQVNSLRFRDVAMRLASDKCFEVNRLLQQAFFEDVVFAQAPYGLYCPAWTTNFVRLSDCSFEEISWIPLLLRSAETFVMDGGRFEAGGNNGWAAFTGSINGTSLTVTSQFQNMIRPGGILFADGGSAILPGTTIVRQISGDPGGVGSYEVNYAQSVASRPLLNIAATIDLDRATVNDAGCQATFNSTYFENTAPVLLRDHHSRDGVSFNNCHMTQSVDKGGFAAPYQCYSDGVVAYGNMDVSVQPVILPNNALITGQTKQKLYGNSNIYKSRALGSVEFKSRRVSQIGNAPIPIVKFHRDATTDFVQSDGVLKVHVNGFDGTSGAAVIGSRTFEISLYGGTLTLLTKADDFTGLVAGATLDIDLAPGANGTDATIRIVPGNFNNSTPSNFWVSYAEAGSSGAPEECLKVTCV